MKIVPVILAGGVGERFWPMSRSSRPKQLLPIVSSHTMLEDTLCRVEGLCDRGTKPLIVTGAGIARAVRTAVKPLRRYDLIAEPQGKNSAPAIAVAAAWLEQRYGDCVMLVVSSDHAISPVNEFNAAVRRAAAVAEADRLVVFGITPTRPDTGYGYIELAGTKTAPKSTVTYEVKRFVEKPDAATARRYVRSGRYLWNGGMFVWKASVIAEEFARYMPELHTQTRECARQRFTPAALRRFYDGCVKESIDYGIMERSQRVSAVAGRFTWDDVGSWEALPRLRGTGTEGTTVDGDAVYSLECPDSIIVNTSGAALACIGIENAVVVTTPDAVLIVSRDKISQLKQHLGAMKKTPGFASDLF